MKPTIVFNGKAIEILKPTVEVLRETLKLDAERRELSTLDFIDRHCEIIARAFGVTADEVYANLSAEDMLPMYNDILAYQLEQLTARFKKNEAEETALQV